MAESQRGVSQTQMGHCCKRGGSRVMEQSVGQGGRVETVSGLESVRPRSRACTTAIVNVVTAAA